MSNNCETKRNFICKLDKYTITPPDNDAPAHLGSPVECENGWNSLDGGLDCFKTFGKEVIYAEARRSCLSMDSSVASIHDLVCFNFLNKTLFIFSDDKSFRKKLAEHRHERAFEISLDRRWKNKNRRLEIDGWIEFCIFELCDGQFRRWKCDYRRWWTLGITGLKLE